MLEEVFFIVFILGWGLDHCIVQVGCSFIVYCLKFGFNLLNTFYLVVRSYSVVGYHPGL